MADEEARLQTLKHISRVCHFIHRFVEQLLIRGETHDASKLQSPEVEMFAKVTGNLNGLTYGSPEYEAQVKAMLSDALGHHYEHNRHHPEHHGDGIDGMNLIDLVEMFCDWRAATERHADGDIYKSIAYNRERFGMCPQLVRIFENTARFIDTQDNDNAQRADVDSGEGTTQGSHRLDRPGEAGLETRVV